MISRFSVLTALTLTLALAACTPGPDIDHGQYWQRSAIADAIYLEGPKAQQTLHRDIGRCVVELRELKGLGAVGDKKQDPKGAQTDEETLAAIDTLARDGFLLNEQSDYQDFEGCMRAKGWERVKYVPFDVAGRARRNFFAAHADYGKDPKDVKPDQTRTPYNE